MARDEDYTLDAGEMIEQQRKAEVLPADLMLIKMENESIMSLARTKPRNNAAIVKELVALIDAYPQAADDAIYSKPVGTVIKCTCGACGRIYEVAKVYDRGDWQTTCDKCESPNIVNQQRVKKFAEGLSVRAAESIRSIYGFTRLETRTTIDAQGMATLTGIFVDYAAGNVTMDSRVVSPYYKQAKTGQMQRTPEDRFLGVVVKAEKSKLRRDIILDSVPNIVKAAFRDHCEKRLEALVDKDEAQTKIVPAFQQYGLTLADLEKIIGTTLAMGWTLAHKMHLKKIITALRNEETTVRELLADLDPQVIDEPQRPTQTEDALTNPQKKANGGATGGKRATKAKESTPTPQPPTQAATEANASGDATPEEFLASLETTFSKAKDASAIGMVYDMAMGPDSPYDWDEDEKAKINDWRQAALERVKK